MIYGRQILQIAFLIRMEGPSHKLTIERTGEMGGDMLTAEIPCKKLSYL